jgi:hypothetical protein
VNVSVAAAEVPKVSELIVTAPVVELIVGWLVIAPDPIWTSSVEPGGVLGVPLTTAQLVLVLH